MSAAEKLFDLDAFTHPYDNQGNVIVETKCPFCRTPKATSYEEVIERLKRRMEVGDAYAFFIMGGYYSGGQNGLPQEVPRKALEFRILSSWTLWRTTE